MRHHELEVVYSKNCNDPNGINEMWPRRSDACSILLVQRRDLVYNVDMYIYIFIHMIVYIPTLFDSSYTMVL